MKNIKGFTVVETLLVILITAVIGFGVYYVWHTHHKKTVIGPTSLSANYAPITIKEWGVTLTPPPTLKGFSYSLNKDNSVLTYSSANESALPAVCQSQVAGVWGIKRIHEGELKAPDGSAVADSVVTNYPNFKHLGVYFYQRLYPQTGCNEANSTTTSLDTAYLEVFASLKT